MNLSVDIGCYHDSTTLLERNLSIGLPIVAAVRTWPLPYWHMLDTDHAVVIIGIEQTHVLLADSAFDDALYQVPVEYFLIVHLTVTECRLSRLRQYAAVSKPNGTLWFRYAPLLNRRFLPTKVNC